MTTDQTAMAASPMDEQSIEPSWMTPMPIRHRETRHLKTASSGSATSATFPHITEVLQWTSLDSTPAHPSSKCPEGLNLASAAFKVYRDRSPTSSTMSSAVMPDSATTYSMPMSPTSSTFTRATTPDIEMTGRETLRCGPHRHWNRQSYDSSSSTFVDSMPDEDRVKDSHREPQHDETLEADGLPAVGTPRPPVETADDNVIPTLKERMSFEVGIDRISSNWDAEPADSSDDEVEGVLNYVLQAAYGVDLEEIGAPQSLLRRFTSRFIQDVGRIAFSGPPATQLTHTTSTSSRSTVLIARAPTRTSQNGKRKKGGPSREGTEDGEDLSEDEGDGGAPFKRARQQIPKEPEENLRLSCPFRKRNPARFNVREHHSCAMTYFPKFAELRQHIVKQHKRIDPSAFVCDRCNRDFAARKDLRDHQRLPRELMCDIADHDPECGIDGPTAAKLLSRKRAGGTSAEVQWMEIWNLVFPDDGDHEVVNWDFCPVIEHFEVTGRFLASLKALEGSLRNKGLNEQALETIGNVYRNQFIQVVEQCVGEARTRPYSNRSNRKGEVTTTMPGPLRRGPRPDSGVDVDEGSSEDSLSFALLGSGFGMDDGLGRCSSTGTEIRASNGAGGRVLMPVMEQIPGEGSEYGLNTAANVGAGYDNFTSGMTPEMMSGSWAYGAPQVNLGTGLVETLPGAEPGPGSGLYAGWDVGMPLNQAGQYSFPGYTPR